MKKANGRKLFISYAIIRHFINVCSKKKIIPNAVVYTTALGILFFGIYVTRRVKNGIEFKSA